VLKEKYSLAFSLTMYVNQSRWRKITRRFCQRNV